ncbi:hypothetical protein CK203_038987 [Vitis vinifera]|uniref:Reverse transcriptase zinc-binding domain-containing protein n=1 Tax=Vitis vinifera TaxID=29760 RepID=A0A438HM06_VITVI|nr:hypothetical protein CK203_038987 [Vitis vinifera]
MGVLVSTNQHVFIRGRQILDATLITNEVVDSKLKANVSGLLLKLDIEKAFDHEISSLKVNRDKSEVIPIGRIESLEDVVSVMGYRVGKLPTFYLGLPLVTREVEDALSWKETRDGIFSVKSLYCSFTRAYSDPFPWGLIWRSWAPMKVSFFAWEASWNRISTIDQLKKRGWNMSHSGFCILQLKGICLVGMVPLWVRGGRRLGGLSLYA